MSELIEPDFENQVEEVNGTHQRVEQIKNNAKAGGCGCNKNKAKIDGDDPIYNEEPKKKTLFIILAIIVVGTFIYYVNKGKKIPVPAVPEV